MPTLLEPNDLRIASRSLGLCGDISFEAEGHLKTDFIHNTHYRLRSNTEFFFFGFGVWSLHDGTKPTWHDGLGPVSGVCRGVSTWPHHFHAQETFLQHTNYQKQWYCIQRRLTDTLLGVLRYQKSVVTTHSPLGAPFTAKWANAPESGPTSPDTTSRLPPIFSCVSFVIICLSIILKALRRSGIAYYIRPCPGLDPGA
jgi:hypothetical protein